MSDPLEALLRPVAAVLNRNIGETTPARDLVRKLDGRVVAIRVRDTALAMFFRFDNGLVDLRTDYGDDPDVVITGSLLTLARLATSEGDGIADLDGIDLAGDARAARAFQDLLGYAKPDIEEELSRYVGDTAAHGLGSLARSFRDWVSGVRSTMHANIREYLQEESRDVPSRYETERFARDVGRLRDDVDRAEARLKKLEQGR